MSRTKRLSTAHHARCVASFLCAGGSAVVGSFFYYAPSPILPLDTQKLLHCNGSLPTGGKPTGFPEARHARPVRALGSSRTPSGPSSYVTLGGGTFPPLL